MLTHCKPPGGLLCLSITARGLQDRKPHPYLGHSRVVWWGSQLRAEIGKSTASSRQTRIIKPLCRTPILGCDSVFNVMHLLLLSLLLGM